MGKVQASQRRKALTTKGESEPVKFFRREFDIDVVAEFEKLKRIAELPANEYRDRMALSREINSAALHAYRANMIYLKAKREREMFKIDFAREMRELHRKATKNCAAWIKKEKLASKKQVTKDMIEQELATDPELRRPYVRLLAHLEDLREIRDNCKSLAEQWSDRKGLLQTQAKLLTQELEHVFGCSKGGSS